MPSSAVAGSNPEVALSLQGLNHRDQRLANGGNQFSLEPPDQALCVGTASRSRHQQRLRVYSSSTGTLSPASMDLNTFFGYPAAINRATGAFGPNVIDPICLYDPGIHRFVVAITTLHVDDDGDVQRQEHDRRRRINTGDPTGPGRSTTFPLRTTGRTARPNHGCTLDGTTPGPCFQDYPHIGADANGVYITTNEYDLFGPSFNAAQIFAFSNTQLAAHPASITVTLVENLEVDGSPGFTVWPATRTPATTPRTRTGRSTS